MEDSGWRHYRHRHRSARGWPCLAPDGIAHRSIGVGPVSCGIIILAGEVAYHRYRQRNIAAGKARSNGDTWEM